jgi:hypothetical protein
LALGELVKAAAEPAMRTVTAANFIFLVILVSGTTRVDVRNAGVATLLRTRDAR